MKILKISIERLPHFKNNLEIDFVAQQRVDNNDREQLYNVFSNIYTNPEFSFIGINESGKTTILKVISFVIELLNNKPVNNISSKEILDDMESGERVVFSSFFYHDNIVYKLETSIGKKESPVDGRNDCTCTQGAENRHGSPGHIAHRHSGGQCSDSRPAILHQSDEKRKQDHTV